MPLPLSQPVTTAPPVDHAWRRMLHSGRIVVGGSVLLAMLMLCIITLPWTSREQTHSGLYFDRQDLSLSRTGPAFSNGLATWLGTDILGRSLLGRSLLGGAISLAIGVAAAMISVVLGVSVGLFAGYRGGWVDSLLMRTVDVLYGLPYILLVVLFKIALEPVFSRWFTAQAGNLVVLFLAIGLVSWLTMARVVRGQVLSLRSQPFIEACRATGLTESRIFLRHLLPNLIGPITVYATLIIPQAILQESFLSFSGHRHPAPHANVGLAGQ